MSEESKKVLLEWVDSAQRVVRAAKEAQSALQQTRAALTGGLDTWKAAAVASHVLNNLTHALEAFEKVEKKNDVPPRPRGYEL